MKAILTALVVVAISGAGCRRAADAPPPVPPAQTTSPEASAVQSPPPSVSPPAPPAAPLTMAEAATPHDVTLPAGTRVGVRLNETVSSDASRAGDEVDVTVIQAVTVREAVVIPAGARIKGRVSAVAAAGKVKGRASLALDFSSLEAAGERYVISAHMSRVAPATKGADAAKVGIPAGGGALIGGLIGGKQGAAAGAAVGGGAGAAVVLSTPGKPVALPKGSVMSLRLEKPVTIHVPKK